MVEALHYKPEGRGFDLLRFNWTFSMYLILPAALCPWVYSASNENEYQKIFGEVGGGVYRAVAHRADNLTAICEPIVYTMWDPQLLTIL
jgi:hypothetical protein